MNEFIDTQEWFPIHQLPGFECCIEYYISRSGQVKSTKGRKETILKGGKIKNGYIKVTLQQRLGQGPEKQAYIHTLVALAFLGKPPTPLGRQKGCTVVDHIDDNKENNSVENLQYLSVKDNICKRPYRKFQKVEKTDDQKLVEKCRQKYNARIRQRKLRDKRKKAKME
nr:hypothetical protein 93 [Pelagibacteraceae bacterium]